jgi:hypothetical protein
MNMQRYALTSDNDTILAHEALPQVDYCCPECRGILRVKKGEERVTHFFHLSENINCRLRFKNTLHSSVQKWLIEKLGQDNCTEECFFPSIHRIADVAYHPQKVVFEVQLSPMTAQEMIERTEAYYRASWHVIWILHSHTFGRYEASELEEAISLIPHYFTDIGYRFGRLYDESSFVRGNRRVFLGLPPRRIFFDTVEIVPRGPLAIQKYERLPQLSFEQLLFQRKSFWSCHLKGDFIDKYSGEAIAFKEESPPRVDYIKQTLFKLYLWYLRVIS